MSDLKFCTYCSRQRPAEGFVKLRVGKLGSPRIKWKCASCYAEVGLATAGRDAAGNQITKERRAIASANQLISHKYRKE